MKTSYLMLFVILVSSGCSTNSDGGTTIGVKGSAYWVGKAPHKDVIPFLDEKKTYELCTAWDKYHDMAEVRRRISDALVRRGEPEDKCYNQASDRLRQISEASRSTTYTPQPARTPTRINCTTYNDRLGGQTYCNAY